MIRRTPHRELPRSIVWLSLVVYCRWVETLTRGVVLTGPWYAWPRIECLLRETVPTNVATRHTPRLRWEAHSGFR
jgi:hypothetical protein